MTRGPVFLRPSDPRSYGWTVEHHFDLSHIKSLGLILCLAFYPDQVWYIHKVKFLYF